jgi:hypothetical protein
VGIQEDFRKLVNGYKDGSGDEGKELPGEVDFGLNEAGPDDIPTRVKVPPKKDSPRPRSNSKTELVIKDIKGNIEEQLYDIGVVVGETGLATAGYVICDGAQTFADSLVEMARNKPRLLKVLEKTGRTANFSKIAKYMLAVAFAFMVDMETRDPYAFQMKYLGVTKAYEATHPDGPASPQGEPFVFISPPTFG